MSGAGSSISTDAEGYQATLHDMLDLVVLHPRNFHARLTWVDLPHLQLLRANESSARVAFLRLPPEQVFVYFPTRRGPVLVHGGLEVQLGDLIWHGHDGPTHQRTTAASRWGSVSVSPEALISFGRSIAGKALSAPTYPRLVRPAGEENRQLLRLHAQAARIAETSPDRIVNPAVMRALDQDLMALLVSCLATGDVPADDPAREQQVRLCVQFEHVLGATPFRLLSVREVCEALGTSENKLRRSCLRMLGMGPARYQHLRRLKLVRAALRRLGVEGRELGEIVARYGFTDLHHFVADYWHAYGEMPSVPPRNK